MLATGCFDVSVLRCFDPFLIKRQFTAFHPRGDQIDDRAGLASPQFCDFLETVSGLQQAKCFSPRWYLLFCALARARTIFESPQCIQNLRTVSFGLPLTETVDLA